MLFTMIETDANGSRIDDFEEPFTQADIDHWVEHNAGETIATADADVETIYTCNGMFIGFQSRAVCQMKS